LGETGKPSVFRFAPTPNGEMHLGHALSALIGFEQARDCGGRLLVRIEDIDLARSRPQFVHGIFADLAWLGISWEEPVVYQSMRFAAYRAAAQRLEEMGLLYPCFATRAEIDAAASSGKTDPDGAPLYPGLFRDRDPREVTERSASGEAFALRIDMAAAVAMASAKRGAEALAFTEIGQDGTAQTIHAKPQRWGDAVIVRKDVPASYHLAVVVDDAWQGVTHVTRGRDLFHATDLHRLLQVLLDLPAPIYHHHRLVTDTDGRKLAKSARDTSLRSLRDNGLGPVDVRRLVGLPEAR
jgi:glutamyl-Q tRNA(Asp) synthetase